MADFVLLYTGGGMPEDEAEQTKILQSWTAWYEKLGSAVVDQGNPFTPVAKTIAPDGTVSDGPVGTMSSGYSIIKADTLDEAIVLAKGCPMLQGGGHISVYEAFPAM